MKKKLAHHLSVAEDRELDPETAQVDATLALVHAVREQTEVLAELVSIVRETMKETP